MLDKFSILIEFHNLSDEYGQYLHYFLYSHSIWGKLLKKKEKEQIKVPL